MQDLRYGGAAYKSTGRDFGFKHLSFVAIYSSYARSHFYYAVEVRCGQCVLRGCRAAIACELRSALGFRWVKLIPAAASGSEQR